jgi:thiamine biosynthesis lipoprotein
MRAAAALLAALSLAACGPAAQQLDEQRLFAMGTWVDIAVQTDDRPAADAAIDRAQQMLLGFERDYYPWADGALAHVNRAIAAGRPVRVAPRLAALLERARRLSAASGGNFDPGVGSLVQLWGFDKDPDRSRKPPGAAAIAAWLRNKPTIASLHIDGDVVRSDQRSVLLDLGGIAKGAAVDSIIAQLRAAGFDDALVNAGGDLRCIGRHNGRPWRIGIKSPRGAGVLGVIELAGGEAAVTSGDYERFFRYDGRRLGHILDPATGLPVEHTEAVTVIASDATTADAAATAVFVAGPRRWRQVARAMGVEAVLRVDASGKIEVTREMRDRLQKVNVKDSDIIVVDS